MTPIRQPFLVAADSAALLADPAVESSWAKPSALEGFAVSGLAGHLAAQALFVPTTLRRSPREVELVSLLDHYDRVTWIDAGVDAEINVGIRRTGDERAADGPAQLAEQASNVVDELRELLADEPEDRCVRPPAGPWGLRLDDFLITRMMEIAVHSDDLAYSVGIETPALPPSVLQPVFSLLTDLATKRHGAPALLRALTRVERAPGAINAF